MRNLTTWEVDIRSINPPLNGHSLSELDSPVEDLELGLPRAEVGVPRPQALLERGHRLLPASLAFRQLLLSVHSEHQQVVARLFAKRADLFPVDHRHDAGGIKTPAEAPYRFHVAHLDAVTGTSTIR